MAQPLSIFRFENQTIDTIVQPDVVASASNDRLLVARNTTVEVHDIKNLSTNKVLMFPTISTVICMVHCKVGDYISTMEVKMENEIRIVNCRIYVNWWRAAIPPSSTINSTTSLVMRCRNIGEVPKSNILPQDRYFDMIDMLLDDVASIACCQATGRLAVCSKNQIYLYNMVNCNYLEPSHGSYLDFEVWPNTFQFVFNPTIISIIGDVMAAGHKDHMIVFKLGKVGKDESSSNNNNSYGESSSGGIDCSEVDDIDEEIQSEAKKSVVNNGIISVSKMVELIESNVDEHLKDVLHPNSFPIAVHLPGLNNDALRAHKTNLPFISRPTSNEPVAIKSAEGSTDYSLTFLLNLEHSLIDIVEDRFIDVVFCPIYSITKDNFATSSPDDVLKIKRKDDQKLSSLICFITTPREGFLYYISMKNNDAYKASLVGNYTYSAPLLNVCLDYYILHVLTKAGVETYNLPTNRCIVQNWKKDFKFKENYVSLLNTHPFLDVFDFAVTEHYMVIFTTPNENAEVTKPQGTVYYLKMPDADKIFMNFIAESHQFKFLNEEKFRYIVTEAYSAVHVALNFEVNNPLSDRQTVQHCYRNISIELAEKCLKGKCLEDWKCGVQHFLHANCDMEEYLTRMKIKMHYQNINVIEGLLYLIRKWLRKNYGLLTPAVADCIVELGQKKVDHKSYFARLVLTEEVMRNTAGNNILPIMRKNLDSSNSVDEDLEIILAVIVLHISCNQIDEGWSFLQNIILEDPINNELINLMVRYKCILFNKEEGKYKSLSKFASFCVERSPAVLSHVLARILLESKNLHLDEILMMLTDSSINENGISVLKLFLELVFSNKSDLQNSEPGYDIGLAMLTRSYIADLQMYQKHMNVKETSEYKPIFSEKFPAFLHLIPCPYDKNYTSLYKLQDLIYSGLLDENGLKDLHECITKILPMQLTLHLSVLLNSKKVVNLLLENFPEVLPQYAKDMYIKKEEWKSALSLLWEKITMEKCNHYNVYYQSLNGILEHLAYTVTTDQLDSIMSPIIQNTNPLYHRYIMMSQQIGYADNIKELIKTTGQQLLISLSSSGV